MRSYDPRYETLSRLSPEGLFRISRGLRRLTRDYDVTDYPVDCFALLGRIRAAGRIPLEVRTEDRLTDSFEATAMFFPELRRYLVIVRTPPRDWRLRSAGRRVNFSLAHELGHIFCGHLDLPLGAKPRAMRRSDEDEADEFAARLLMPERLILRSEFSSAEELARAFLVSEQACFRRLNNLRRLDRLSAPRRSVCPVCGNDRLAPAARYCAICGTGLPEEGANGVRVAEYAYHLTDESGRVLICPACGAEPEAGEDVCRACGLPLRNRCADEGFWIPCGHVNPSNARFCELCGARTEYARRGLLKDWREERRAYTRAVT